MKIFKRFLAVFVAVVISLFVVGNDKVYAYDFSFLEAVNSVDSQETLRSYLVDYWRSTTSTDNPISDIGLEMSRDELEVLCVSLNEAGFPCYVKYVSDLLPGGACYVICGTGYVVADKFVGVDTYDISGRIHTNSIGRPYFSYSLENSLSLLQTIETMLQNIYDRIDALADTLVMQDPLEEWLQLFYAQIEVVQLRQELVNLQLDELIEAVEGLSVVGGGDVNFDTTSITDKLEEVITAVGGITFDTTPITNKLDGVISAVNRIDFDTAPVTDKLDDVIAAVNGISFDTAPVVDAINGISFDTLPITDKLDDVVDAVNGIEFDTAPIAVKLDELFFAINDTAFDDSSILGKLTQLSTDLRASIFDGFSSSALYHRVNSILGYVADTEEVVAQMPDALGNLLDELQKISTYTADVPIEVEVPGKLGAVAVTPLNGWSYQNLSFTYQPSSSLQTVTPSFGSVAVKDTTPLYTNWLPIAWTSVTDSTPYNGTGFKSGVFLDGNSVGYESGWVTTGFIPASPGMTLRVSGISFFSNGPQSRAIESGAEPMIVFYDSLGKMTRSFSLGSNSNATSFTQDLSYSRFGDFAFIRICLPWMNENSVITLNEEIFEGAYYDILLSGDNATLTLSRDVWLSYFDTTTLGSTRFLLTSKYGGVQKFEVNAESLFEGVSIAVAGSSASDLLSTYRLAVTCSFDMLSQLDAALDAALNISVSSVVYPTAETLTFVADGETFTVPLGATYGFTAESGDSVFLQDDVWVFRNEAGSHSLAGHDTYLTDALTSAPTTSTVIESRVYEWFEWFYNNSGSIGSNGTGGNINIENNTSVINISRLVDKLTDIEEVLQEDSAATLSRLDEILEQMSATVGAGSCDHVYVSEINQEQTCILPGLQTFTCESCGSSYSEILESLGHDWQCTGHVEDELDPETGEVLSSGYDIYTCSRCSDSYNDYEGSGAPAAESNSLTGIISRVFEKLGTLVGDLLSMGVRLLDKMLTGFDDLVTSFNEKTQQIVNFGSGYTAWLSGFWDIVPSDLQLVWGFCLAVVCIGIVGKKLFFTT